MQVATRKPVEVAPPRMGPLAKLPVFLDLAGRRVVVAGGTVQAVWKAELVAAAGAHVEVYAQELCEELTELIARGVPPGSFKHHARTWDDDIFAGADLALCAARDDEEAQRFYDAARKAGVLVNVIDRAAFCQFQLGSIVNRSPVVVAISTDGAAPILAQAIRRRIETLLPPSLAAWGAIAKRLRATVNQTLSSGAQKRAFWERLSERAFGAAPAATAEADMKAVIAEVGTSPIVASGRVTLVGAGPGDAEMLTLKALRALQSADVVLFDDLVSDDVLELARREARRMLVGKRGKRASCAQEDINDLMVSLARQGKHVVRLKSGDPMIFGRGGEELERLEREGISCTVVPGITSASAMAASLGVSLTHRDAAHSVQFVTGHGRQGDLGEHWEAEGLADPRSTLIVYMGGRTAAKLAARLLARGLPASTPVACVADVGRASEQRSFTTLEALASNGIAVAAWDGAAPILLGIGRVFQAKLEAAACLEGLERAGGRRQA